LGILFIDLHHDFSGTGSRLNTKCACINSYLFLRNVMDKPIVNHSLDLEKNSLTQKLDNLSILAKGFDSSVEPEYLLKAISNLEKRIKILAQKGSA
jgi:hypothetical protein